MTAEITREAARKILSDWRIDGLDPMKMARAWMVNLIPSWK